MVDIGTGADSPVHRILDEHGDLVDQGGRYPSLERCLELYRKMVVGRRFSRQATALAKQGRLTVYPSSEGQEACQVGVVAALRPTDWLFPTYRDCTALVARNIDPIEVLTLMRGDWHCGYDPRAHRTAPQSTPLATHALHAVGVACAAQLAGDDVVAMALVGDGATSEGDFHEACNFAAVFKAPVVIVVQNNQYAISVPFDRQTAAERLADKAIGYGMKGCVVDGNDVLAVTDVVSDAVESARAGRGPTLVEALTFRLEPHTNADDERRYRSADEVELWRARDPLVRMQAFLRDQGALGDAIAAGIDAEADALAADVRTRITEETARDVDEIFAHVYSEMTPQLRGEAHAAAAWLKADPIRPDEGP